MKNDSFEKVLGYLAAVSEVPLTTPKRTFEVKPLIVSPFTWRSYSCPAGCGACCFNFSLDYIPGEPMPDRVQPRQVTVNGRSFEILTDGQEDNATSRCRYVSLVDGRCGNYPTRPLSCRIPLIQFLHREQHYILISKLYGRGWNMKRIDDQKGAQCSMLGWSEDTRNELRREFTSLKGWAEYFQIPHRVDSLLELLETAPHTRPARVYADRPVLIG